MERVAEAAPPGRPHPWGELVIGALTISTTELLQQIAATPQQPAAPTPEAPSLPSLDEEDAIQCYSDGWRVRWATG